MSWISRQTRKWATASVRDAKLG